MTWPYEEAQTSPSLPWWSQKPIWETRPSKAIYTQRPFKRFWTGLTNFFTNARGISASKSINWAPTSSCLHESYDPSTLLPFVLGQKLPDWKKIDNMVRMIVKEPTGSRCTSSIVLRTKKNLSLCFWMDYRNLNSLKVKNAELIMKWMRFCKPPWSINNLNVEKQFRIMANHDRWPAKWQNINHI